MDRSVQSVLDQSTSRYRLLEQQAQPIASLEDNLSRVVSQSGVESSKTNQLTEIVERKDDDVPSSSPSQLDTIQTMLEKLMTAQVPRSRSKSGSCANISSEHASPTEDRMTLDYPRALEPLMPSIQRLYSLAGMNEKTLDANEAEEIIESLKGLLKAAFPNTSKTTLGKRKQGDDFTPQKVDYKRIRGLLDVNYKVTVNKRGK